MIKHASTLVFVGSIWLLLFRVPEPSPEHCLHDVHAVARSTEHGPGQGEPLPHAEAERGGHAAQQRGPSRGGSRGGGGRQQWAAEMSEEGPGAARAAAEGDQCQADRPGVCFCEYTVSDLPASVVSPDVALGGWLGSKHQLRWEGRMQTCISELVCRCVSVNVRGCIMPVSFQKLDDTGGWGD